MTLDRLGHDRDGALDLGVADQPVGDERIRLVSRSSTRSPAARGARPAPTARCPSPPTSASTMFVSTTSGRGSRPGSRRARRRARARGGGRRRRGRASCRGRRAPPPRRCRPGGSSSRRAGAASSRTRSTTASLPASTAPNGAERLLLSDSDDGVRGPGEVGERDPERDGRVHEPGAVDVDAAVVPLRGRRERLRQLGRERRAARPRVRVLEHEQRGMPLGRSAPPPRPGSIRPSAAKSGTGSSRAISVDPRSPRR